MQKVRVPINSFQYGEVSDSLIMRTDTPIYAQSAQRLENLVVMGEGSVKKRYGLHKMHDYGITDVQGTQPDKSHLFRFVFDDNERYVIAVMGGKIKCFRDTGSGSLGLVDTVTQDVDGNPLPFSESYLQQYTYAQYGDVMFISHPLFAPRTIVRTSLTTFEVDTFVFDVRADNQVTYQPYTKYQANDVTLDPSATTGTITLTTSADYWDTTGTQDGSGNYPDSLHVGVTVRYGEAEIDITSVQSATQATGTVIEEIKRRLTVLNPLRTTDGSNVVEVTMLSHGFAGGEAITIEDAAPTGGINSASINGSRTVLEIIDENTFSYTAGATANTSEDGGGYVTIVSHAPTLDWDEQSWSAKRGYPAAVTFHENRLCFGGTLAEPDAIWMSKIGEYFNFDVGEAADTDSINLIAATGDVNEIRYMVSNRDLQVFTASGELYVPTYLNQAITPTNAQIRKQTPYGTEYVQPVSIDGATIFAQKDGRVIREYIYTDAEDAYTASSVSTLASHLIDAPKYLTVAHSGFGLSDSYAVLTLGSGEIALFSSNRAERRASWTRATLENGSFGSVVAIHDEIYANVWYDDRLYLCRFAEEFPLDMWYYTQSAANTYIVTVSSDKFPLNSELYVYAYRNNEYEFVGQYTKTDPTFYIDLSGLDPSFRRTGDYISIAIGTGISTKLVTNPVDASMGSGPTTGEPRGITNVVVDVKSTSSMTVNSRPCISSDFSGKKEVKLLGYSRNPKVTIESNGNNSVQINGIVAELII